MDMIAMGFATEAVITITGPKWISFFLLPLVRRHELCMADVHSREFSFFYRLSPTSRLHRIHWTLCHGFTSTVSDFLFSKFIVLLFSDRLLTMLFSPP